MCLDDGQLIGCGLLDRCGLSQTVVWMDANSACFTQNFNYIFVAKSYCTDVWQAVQLGGLFKWQDDMSTTWSHILNNNCLFGLSYGLNVE